MSELEKAARALVEALDRCHNDPQFQSHATMAAMRLGDYTGPTYRDELAVLRAALEADAGWVDVIPGWSAGSYEYRLQHRPLVDYDNDQAPHPHEGDGDICARCGEHRSWHGDA